MLDVHRQRMSNGVGQHLMHGLADELSEQEDRTRTRRGEHRGENRRDGAVWKIVTEVGQRVEAGDTIMIIESMKMEIPVVVEETGTVEQFLVEEDDAVSRRPGRGHPRSVAVAERARA